MQLRITPSLAQACCKSANFRKTIKMKHNKDVELEKLEKILRMPVTDINFVGDQVELKTTGDTYIGAQKWIKDAANIIIYDITDTSKNWLKWDKIYMANRIKIEEQVQVLYERKDLNLTLSTYGRIIVRDQQSNILGSAMVFFDNGSWSAIKV